MKVLMISLGDEFMDKPEGEVVRRHQNYAQAAGAKVLMVTYSPRRNNRKPRDFGQGFAVWPTRSWSALTFVLDAWRIAARLCLTKKIDLIYTQDPFATALVGWLLKKRFKLPLIIQNHSCFIDNKTWLAERPKVFPWLNRLAKFLLPRADGWRVVNRVEKDIYVESLNLPPSKIRVLNVPIEVARFAQPCKPEELAEVRQYLGAKPEDVILLWVGRPVRFKRLPELFAAWRRIVDARPNVVPVLIGKESEAQEDLRAQIELHGLKGRIRWLDQGASQGQLPYYYQAADIYFHSSNYEGFGRVMVEASAAGLPVVATDTPGAREIIEQGLTGLIVPVDDSLAMAEAGLRLIDDPVRRREMGRMAADKVAAQFDAQADTRAIARLWQEVVERWRNAG